PLKAHIAGKGLVDDGAHHPGKVVDHHKGNKRIKETVHLSEEPAQPAADSGKHHLNPIPYSLHKKSSFYIGNERPPYSKAPVPVLYLLRHDLPQPHILLS